MSVATRAVAIQLRSRVRRRAAASPIHPLFSGHDAASGTAITRISRLQPLRSTHPFWSFREFSMFNQSVDNSDLTELAHSSEEVLVAKKEATLGNLLDRSPDRVNTEDYLTVLRTLAASKLPDAPLRAERWLNRLEQHAGDAMPATTNSSSSYFERPSSTAGLVVPTSECYQRVIEAWAEATSEDPGRIVTRTERWLWKHIESPSEVTRPDTACFNAFLDVCTKGRAFKNSQKSKMIVEHAQKAENVLRFMIAMRRKEGPDCKMKPNSESFNLVIRGWTRCRKSLDIVDRTMDALSLMEQYQSSVDGCVRPDSKSYGMTMDSISVRAKLKVKCSRGPLGKSSRNNPSENGLAEIQLLSNMIDFFHEKRKAGDSVIAPSTYTYNILLGCWANVAILHEHAPSEAEKILRHMTYLKEQGVDGVGPDSTSYLMVMRAWANTSKLNRGQRIAWLLSKQWKDFHFVGCASLRPTVNSYNTVIQAWMSLMEPLEAEKIFSELLQLSEQDESGKLRPNSESFSLIIRAWLAVADNGSEAALITAAKYLDALEAREKTESGISSSVELFTIFLAAARKCAAHSPQTLEVTIEVFDKLRSSRHMIDCLHYSRLLQIGLLALSKVTSNQVRTSFIDHVVTESKKAGLVSSAMLQALANGPTYVDGWTVDESKRMVVDLFPEWPLPASWTRNVRQEGQLPKENDLYRTQFFLAHHGIDPFPNQH